MQTQNKKGFTLIELLIVIGILAVLATVTVLVLNPAELFRQARDSQRLSDLGSLKGALALYLTTASTPDLSGGTFSCATNFGADKAALASTAFAGGAASAYTLKTSAATTSITGTGWVPVDFNGMNGGSPLSVLPRDPNVGDATTYYAYACSEISGATNLTFELNAKMESTRYTTAPDDVITTDGGNQAARYETGTYPALAL